MELNITNCRLTVGSIDILAVSASSLVLIGDTQTIQLASAFDTPPESLIIGPTVPFNPVG
ncbi:spore gernimation protein GerPD [Peribacillus sp. SCS-155]|uniref:spore gernimation protein GerPD n=1 Tax=Peribacillus sedimenti TaxID=3115297 RepID=UPI0039069075